MCLPCEIIVLLLLSLGIEADLTCFVFSKLLDPTTARRPRNVHLDSFTPWVGDKHLNGLYFALNPLCNIRCFIHISSIF